MGYKIIEACNGCGACVPECPVDAITESGIDAEKCNDCGACVNVCLVDAIIEL